MQENKFRTVVSKVQSFVGNPEYLLTTNTYCKGNISVISSNLQHFRSVVSGILQEDIDQFSQLKTKDFLSKITDKCSYTH